VPKGHYIAKQTPWGETAPLRLAMHHPAPPEYDPSQYKRPVPAVVPPVCRTCRKAFAEVGTAGRCLDCWAFAAARWHWAGVTCRIARSRITE
jgi:hypothetical protein